MTNEVAREFWKASGGQAFGTTLATDPAFGELNAAESQELASLFPPLEGRRVLELGAGVGRLTRVLADAGASVMALDISRDAVERNRDRHREYPNVQCLEADVISCELGDGPYDFVLCNWLLMYLDEADVQSLFSRLSKCVSPTGQVLVRESCENNYRGAHYFKHVLTRDLLLGFLPPFTHMTYNFWRFKISSLRRLLWFLPRSSQLQVYRSAKTYEGWFRERFVIRKSGALQTYVEAYRNEHQRYWVLEPKEWV